MKNGRLSLLTWGLLLALALGPGALAQTVTISYGHTDENIGFVRLVELFNQEHDDIQVEFVPIGSYTEAITTQIVGGTGPDVFFVHPYELVSWARSGLLTDLTPFVERDAHTLDLDEYFPYALDTARVDGRYYAWPYGLVESGRLIYNVDLFEGAGMAVPDETWTWEDFRAAAARFVQDRNADGVQDQWGSNRMGFREILQYVLEAGGRFYNDDFTQFLPDREPATEALQFAADMYTSGITSVQIRGGQWESGSVAMWFHHLPGAISTLWYHDDFRAESTVQPMHSNGVRRILFHSNMFGINPNSPNKEAAWEFIRWASRPEGYARASFEAWGIAQTLPPRRDAALSHYFEVDPTRGPAGLRPEISIQVVAEWGVPEVMPAAHREVEDLFANRWVAVETGAIPPQTFYDMIIPAINAILRERR